MRFFYLLLCLFISLNFANASAENLEDVYKLAIKNDQTFLNATATRQASAEALPQAMSVLFPQISAVGNTAINRVTNSNTTSYNGFYKYNTNGYTVNLAMPLLNFNNWYNVGQAKNQVKQADATYADAAQTLILNTANAYFAVLSAEDTLRITQAKKAYLAKQLAQTKARYEVGVDAKTAVYNAQSSYDSAAATEISNKNSLYSAYLQLQVMTNKPIDSLARLTDNLPLMPPTPTRLDAWREAADTRNFALLATRFGADAARDNVKALNANHLPSLSTVDSYQYAVTGASVNTSNLRSVTKTATGGLQLNVPLFAGGQVLSQVRQAQAQYVAATATMELQHRQVDSNIVQTFNSVLAGISQINADRAAIVSANSALQSNEASYQAGTMTIVDVLNAVQNLYAAMQTFATDQYTYLTNTLTLKQLAGNLTNLDVAAINQWLTNGNTIPQHVIAQQVAPTPAMPAPQPAPNNKTTTAVPTKK